MLRPRSIIILLVGIVAPPIALYYILLEWKAALIIWIVCILGAIWLARK